MISDCWITGTSRGKYFNNPPAFQKILILSYTSPAGTDPQPGVLHDLVTFTCLTSHLQALAVEETRPKIDSTLLERPIHNTWDDGQ
jgi:hypothetical protein